MIKNILLLIILISSFEILILVNNYQEEKQLDDKFSINSLSMYINSFENRYTDYREKNYYNNEHIDDISKKLNRYLNSVMENKGNYIVESSLALGIDPYLVAAIILQETGCAWNCSSLTVKCNNVGGNVGSPSCPGSRYRKFDTIEDGIDFAINKVNSYYKKGLTTPKEIGPKYATDPTWSKKIQNYINKLKK